MCCPDGVLVFPQAKEWICQLAGAQGSFHSFFTEEVSKLLKEPLRGGSSPSLGSEQLARAVLLAVSAEISSGER